MSWFVFVVRLTDLFTGEDRDAIIRQLRDAGIGSNNYFPPIHLQPYMRERFGFKEGDFPVCEHVAARTLALPFFNRLSEQQIERVCETLLQVVEKQLMTGKRRL
jgi:perosamine synthetase